MTCSRLFEVCTVTMEWGWRHGRGGSGGWMASRCGGRGDMIDVEKKEGES